MCPQKQAKWAKSRCEEWNTTANSFLDAPSFKCLPPSSVPVHHFSSKFGCYPFQKEVMKRLVIKEQSSKSAAQCRDQPWLQISFPFMWGSLKAAFCYLRVVLLLGCCCECCGWRCSITLYREKKKKRSNIYYLFNRFYSKMLFMN